MGNEQLSDQQLQWLGQLLIRVHRHYQQRQPDPLPNQPPRPPTPMVRWIERLQQNDLGLRCQWLCHLLRIPGRLPGCHRLPGDPVRRFPWEDEDAMEEEEDEEDEPMIFSSDTTSEEDDDHRRGRTRREPPKRPRRRLSPDWKPVAQRVVLEGWSDGLIRDAILPLMPGVFLDNHPHPW